MENCINWVDHEIQKRRIFYEFNRYSPLNYYRSKFEYISEKIIVIDILKEIIIKDFTKMVEYFIKKLQQFLFSEEVLNRRNGIYIPVCGNELKELLLSLDPEKIMFSISELKIFSRHLDKSNIKIEMNIPEHLSEIRIELFSDQQLLSLEENSSEKAKKYDRYLRQVYTFIENLNQIIDQSITKYE
jgi:hypothetical protein